MILDSLSNSALYLNLHPRINKAFEFLKNTDLHNISEGKYAIDGDEIFAMVSQYSTKLPENCKPEAHIKYFDIQYMISGIEKIGYAAKFNQVETEVYNLEKDIAFYNAEIETITLKEGSFAIFYPNDIHAPCMQYNNCVEVKKLVVKVLI